MTEHELSYEIIGLQSKFIVFWDPGYWNPLMNFNVPVMKEGIERVVHGLEKLFLNVFSLRIFAPLRLCVKVFII